MLFAIDQLDRTGEWIDGSKCSFYNSQWKELNGWVSGQLYGYLHHLIQLEQTHNLNLTPTDGFLAIKLSYVVQSVQIHPDPRDSRKELELLASKNTLVWGETDTCKQMAANMTESPDMKFSWANRNYQNLQCRKNIHLERSESKRKRERQNKDIECLEGDGLGLGVYDT